MFMSTVRGNMKKFKLKGVALKRKHRLEELRKQFNLCLTRKCGHGHKFGNPIAMREDGTVIEYTDPFRPPQPRGIIIDDPFGPGGYWNEGATL